MDTGSDSGADMGVRTSTVVRYNYGDLDGCRYEKVWVWVMV